MQIRKFSWVWAILPATLSAQQSPVWYEQFRPWKDGLELYQQKNYLSARQRFEMVYPELKSYSDHTSWIFRQQLDFYVAASAAEGYEKDAGKLLRLFIENYPDSRFREKINFLLGRELYREGNYTEAAEKLSLLKDESLAEEEKIEKNFILGYALFTKKKFEDARPLFKTIRTQKGKYYYPSNYYYGFICFYLKDYNEALKSFNSIEDSKLYGPVLPYYIAQIYYFKKDYTKAADYIRKVIEREEVLYKTELRHLLGKCLFQQGEYDKAFPLIEAFTKEQDKVEKEDLFQLAYCQYRAGRCAEAIPSLRDLSLLDEALGQSAAYALADCYLQTNKKEEAKNAFLSAASRKFDPFLTENAVYQYSKLSYEQGNAAEAIRYFESYLADYASGTYRNEVSELLGMALVQTRDYEKAYRIIEQLQINSKPLKEAYQKVTYFRAVELFHDKQWQGSREMLDKSLRFATDPELEALALYLKGEALYQQENYPDAITAYTRFSQLYKSENASPSLFRAYYNLGYCHFRSKAWFKATAWFAKAVEERNKTKDQEGVRILSPDLYLRYADCAFISKEYDKALEGYTAVADNRWAQADYAWFRKGIIRGIRNEAEAKVQDLNTLLRNYPNSPLADKAWYEIGETELDRGRYVQAISAYKKVMDEFPLSPLLPLCQLQRALSLYNHGQKEESKDAYRKLVRQFPDTKESGIALATLKAIYVEEGKVDEYFDFANQSGSRQASVSEQDSLTYRTAMNFYEEGNAIRSRELFSGYLQKFPEGFFAPEAHYFLAELLLKEKDYPGAEIHFSWIADKNQLSFLERSLRVAADLNYYELLDAEKANRFYARLLEVAGNSDNQYIARLGLARTYNRLGNAEATANYATSLIDNGLKSGDRSEVYFLRARARYLNAQPDAALADFRLLASAAEGERGAESAYMVAQILYEKNQFTASLDSCMKIRNQFGSYEKVVVKTFILMARNYAATDKAFQARATLESIVNNYEGDAGLLEEARQLLENIRQEELNKSRIQESSPADSLILEEKLPGQ